MEYSDSSGLDQLTSKSGADCEPRDITKVRLFSVVGTCGCNLWMQLLLNSYDIAGGHDIATANENGRRKRFFDNHERP